MRTFVIPFYYDSGTVISNGSGSGSDFLTSYGSGSGSTRPKVTVPTVPVLQHCFPERVSKDSSGKAKNSRMRRN